MDFIDQLRVLSSQVEKQLPYITTEEATKHSIVLPFISALGYNVFDPTEVVPEFTADVGTKKGEKVDYAIFKEEKPIILFECKCHTCNLDSEHASQLFRYFSVTSAKFGVLTNGIIYRFYTDIEEANKMDPKPFFEFNIIDVKDSTVEVLKRFTRTAFNTEDNFSAALDLKYMKEIKRVLAEEVSSPSETFTRLFASQVYSGRLTQTVIQQFSDITKRAVNQFISDRINDRLKSAMESENDSVADLKAISVQSNGIDDVKDNSGVVTTEQEIEGYYVVKAILSSIIDPKRIVMRDTKSYCGILLDDNNRKPICRFRFDSANWYFCLINADKQEEKITISEVNDIFGFAEQLKDTVRRYDPGILAMS